MFLTKKFNGFDLARIGRFDLEHSENDDRLIVYVKSDDGSITRVYVYADGTTSRERVTGTTFDDEQDSNPTGTGEDLNAQQHKLTLKKKVIVCRARHLVDCDDNDNERHASTGQTGKAEWDATTDQWKVAWDNGGWGFYTNDELLSHAYVADLPQSDGATVSDTN